MKLTKPTLKTAVAGLLTAAIAGGGLLAFASSAFATGTAPPWEPDTNAAAYGNLTFYNAGGNQVTSGTNLSSPFSYVVASTARDTGATKATVAFYNPQHGVSPAYWTGTSETGPTTFNPSTSLPAGTPADIVADAPTYPVTAASAADISTWLAANIPDTTAGYANTIEVRLTDSGPGLHGNAPGTYWETDIGYNTTPSPITVDGTTVPADGWAVLFPFVAPTTTSLATSASTEWPLTTGDPITLTATVSSTASGTVQFYDNGTLLADSTTPGSGSYTYNYTPAAGTHVYTATFVPSPTDETGGNTATAAFLGGSTSAGVTVTDAPLPVLTISGSNAQDIDTAGDVANLSPTAADTFDISIAHSVSGDEYEVAVCNPDASNPNPLTGAQGPCNEPLGGDPIIGNGGTATGTLPFTPGLQNPLVGKSGCPPTGKQIADGDPCIVAFADLSEVLGGDPTPATADAPIFFDSTLSTIGKFKGSTGVGTIESFGGFATDGINPSTDEPGGCQPYTGKSEVWVKVDGKKTLEPLTSWTGEPLCIQGDAVGEGIAASIGGAVLLDPTATAIGSGQANAGWTLGKPAHHAGGVSITLSCALTTELNDLSFGGDGGSLTVYLESLGAGPPDFTGNTGEVQTATLLLPKFTNRQIKLDPTNPSYCP